MILEQNVGENINNNGVVVDKINMKTMDSEVTFYESLSGLDRAEQEAIDSIRSQIENKPLLDLGVGGGRTVVPLQEISKNYIGIDYVKKMVESCREKYPGVKFEQRDARDLSCFEKDTFSLVLFSWSGICMVDHVGRMAIIDEVYRILRPGGYFIFSSYNMDNKKHKNIISFSPFIFSFNPVRFIFHSLNFFKNNLIILSNRIRFVRFEEKNNEYEMVNDRCHNYSTMLYYISLANQKKQLSAAGFKGGTHAFDSHGAINNRKASDDSILYLAQK